MSVDPVQPGVRPDGPRPVPSELPRKHHGTRSILAELLFVCEQVEGAPASSLENCRVASAEEVRHPYVTSRPDVCGGSPIIVDTRFPVRSVVNYVLKQGLSPEELVLEFPHLTLSSATTRSTLPRVE